MSKIELTPKEKEELGNLRVGFNIVKESEDVSILASRRVEMSRKWAKKLLKMSFYLNICTILLYGIAVIFAIMQPIPDFYATTPSGKIVGPLPNLHLK